MMQHENLKAWQMFKKSIAMLLLVLMLFSFGFGTAMADNAGNSDAEANISETFDNLPKEAKVAVGFAVAAGILLFMFFRRDEEEEDPQI